MSCSQEKIKLMHQYLDGGLEKQEEDKLRAHLEECEACQQHFHELKRTITLVQSAGQYKAPDHFTGEVMKKLPAEKKRVKYSRWFKAHPIFTSAAIFFIFMFTGILSSWNQDNELVVSKQENLEIVDDTVIVPEDVTVTGDLTVKNGNLRIDGTVDGDVRLVNGDLIEESTMEGSELMASTGEINGELQQVDQMFEWLWFSLKDLTESIFSFGQITLLGLQK
ncbi:zf-HC2 domain-containing protein [Lentibacillus amyloliquefaciens]|uniref:Anti-sigma-W factor RsiW n=1 Tax=Lentibacillus amyloliquefaciens TaxID=1472767 RepID=A0A0U4E7P5_9BACI|nr:zf-HC2 domain-containing protein [Lentibacillus amyloliquefaciens]ALX49340.1 anti-sigma factor [Lentibacillus amyloliquefaciens]